MEGIGHTLVNLRPRQLFITHNLECLTDGLRIAQQTDEATGKVLVPGQRPK